MLRNEKNEFKKEKTMMYADEKTGNYIHYRMKLKDSVKESTINCFFNFLYSMKLDSGLSSKKVFRENKSTGDLVKSLSRILSSSVINFSDLMVLYSDEETITSSAVTEPLNKFLSMFEFEHPVVYTEEDLRNITMSIRYGVPFKDKSQIQDFREEMVSLKPNTYFMNKIGFKPVQKKNKVLVK